MKFSLLWLRHFLKRYLSSNQNPFAAKLLEIDSAELPELLTSIGLEVEDFVDEADKMKWFQIAQVISLEPHPDSQKLNLCKVNTGTETLDIVCGADNVSAGIKIIFAPIGSIIPVSNLAIKKSKILGRESSGMICSLGELGIDKSSNPDINEGTGRGIAILPDSAPVGEKLTNYLNFDTIFDVAITPNRGDCASVKGVAYDLIAAISAINHPSESVAINSVHSSELKTMEENSKFFKTQPPLDITIKIEDSAKNDALKLRLSTFNLKNQFTLSGKIKALYNQSFNDLPLDLVNLSNFLMFDTGHPNHFYDASKINGNITIRQSKEGEKFITITETELSLPSGLLVIADEEKILSLAGVMGDSRSKITAETRNIVMEAGVFSRKSILATSAKLNIRTDSSYRFERAVDFFGTEEVTLLSSQLLDTPLSSTSVIFGDHSRVSTNSSHSEITLNLNNLNSIAGHEINKEIALNILSNLGFLVHEKAENTFAITPPTRRHDISIEEDLIEEVLRIYNYDNIPNDNKLALSLSASKLNPEDTKVTKKDAKNNPSNDLQHGTQEKLIFQIKQTLSKTLNEVINFSFFKDADHKMLQEKHKNRSKVEIQNPVSSDLSTLRNSLIPSLLSILKRNLSIGENSCKIFEIAKIFFGEEPENQENCIGILRSGFYTLPSHHSNNHRMNDLFDIKSDINLILSENYNMNTEALKYIPTNITSLHPKKQFDILLGNATIATVAQVNPLYLYENFDITSDVFVGEIYLSKLKPPKLKKLKPTNQPQSAEGQNAMKILREISLITPAEVTFFDIKQAINSLKINEITNIEVLDVFTDQERIGQGKKSISLKFHLTQPAGKTLTKDEIDNQIILKLSNHLNEKLSCVLRDGKSAT